MSLTAAQRAEINRQNARKSTGPTSDEGKAASRRNATKHGLRAEVLSLPDEDPTIAAARSDAWNDYYQPQSPGAQHLVNDCVAATLLSDRCHKYHAATLSKQIRSAELDWDTQREDAVAALAVLLKTDPALAVHRLKQSAHGLRWMIEGWERLQAAFDEAGCWTNPELDLAIRLMGFRPEVAKLKECPPAWLTRLYAILCHERPSDTAILQLFEARHLPDLHRREFRADFCPDRESCQRSLGAMIADERERLCECESLLQAFDDPDRAEAGDRALILQDPASARLFLRYHSEARNAFHRSYSALIKALERDAAEAADSDPPSATSPETPADADSPNEARSDANSDAVTTSEPSSGREPALVLPTPLPTVSVEPSPPVRTASARPTPMRLV